MCFNSWPTFSLYFFSTQFWILVPYRISLRKIPSSLFLEYLFSSYSISMTTNGVYGFSMWSRGIEFTCKCRRCKRYKFDPWAGKMPWSWKRQPTPVFMPGESHGQRSLVGYSPWDRRELDKFQQQQLKWCLSAFFVQFNIANSLMWR